MFLVEKVKGFVDVCLPAANSVHLSPVCFLSACLPRTFLCSFYLLSHHPLSCFLRPGTIVDAAFTVTHRGVAKHSVENRTSQYRSLNTSPCQNSTRIL